MVCRVSVRKLVAIPNIVVPAPDLQNTEGHNMCSV